jgi:ribonuclease Z
MVTRKIKGRKIAFICDTLLCDNCFRLAEDADILICEAAYTSALENKAREYKHMTAQQAGLIASKSDVKKLILTHFSQRYKNTEEIEEDAKTVFSNVVCAYDLMKVKL